MAASSWESELPNVLQLFGVHKLKAEQKQILDCIINGRNCMATLPTGFGKSLPFQVYLPLLRATSASTCKPNCFQWKVLVCCPLVSLMQDQVQKLSTISTIQAAYKGSSIENDRKIKDGLIDIIYASPETMVGDQQWREIIQKLDIKLIVVDEFHTIALWGEDDSSHKQAFRKWFSHVGELRSLFPDATVLALSATCTISVRKRVMKVLQLTEDDTVEINLSPNKVNIKLVCSKINNDVAMAMTWLVDALKAKQQAFPRTLIYCSSINDTSKLYKYIVTELPQCAKYVEMYHSETPTENKDLIVNALKDETSEVRIVLSTSALGMGFDVKNCQSVIIFGPPNNLVDLLQEMGRVGRDGSASAALILYNSHHLRKLSVEVKEILKTKDCRRIVLMSYFIKEANLSLLKATDCGKHTCCDLCYDKCSCKSCLQALLPLEQIFSQSVPELDNVSSDSDTEDYDLEDYNYYDDIDMALLEIPNE